MSECTPEPWKSEKMNGNIYVISPEIGLSVAIMTDKTTIGQLQNARRIVACVNRLAPFTTEEIEKGIDLVEIMAKLEAAEAALDRVRSITVGDINKMFDTYWQKNRTRFEYSGVKAGRDAFHEAVRLLTERMEGE